MIPITFLSRRIIVLLSLKAVVSLCFHICEDNPANIFKIVFPSVTTVCYKNKI